MSFRPRILYGKNILAFLGAAAKVQAIEITASSPKAEYLGRVMSDLRSPRVITRLHFEPGQCQQHAALINSYARNQVEKNC